LFPQLVLNVATGCAAVVLFIRKESVTSQYPVG
jgi:hypothetical protein